MKKLCLVTLLSVSLTSHAGIRTPDNKLISTGDSPAKLVHSLGSPTTKSFSTEWCDRKKKSRCMREFWVYFYDGREWTIEIFQNEIVDMDWTRR